MSHEHSPQDPGEQKSLDMVQRTVLSVLLGFVFGAFATVLATYLVVRGAEDLGRSDVLGLWIMTGVMGLVTAIAILLINRRKPYHPLVLLGLLPMAAAAFWIIR